MLAGTGTAVGMAGCSSNPPGGTVTDTATDTPGTGGTPEDTATATPTPDPSELEYTGGEVTLASPGPIQTLDPVAAKGSGAGYNQYQESLFEFTNGRLPAKPSLAKSVSVSNGGKTYTFKLREGVTFHDGTELTASDVVYSWERLAQSDKSRNKDDIIGGTFTIQHEGNTGESFENYVPNSLAIRAPDKYTFEFDLESAFHGAIAQIAGGAFGVIPENSVGDIKGYEGEYGYDEFFGTANGGPKFVGTGPFKVESWSKGSEIVLSRYKDYWGEGPLIDKVRYTVLGNANTRWKRFKNKNLDIVYGIPTADFKPGNRSIERDRGSYRVGNYKLGNGRGVKYGEATALDTDYFVFNTKRTERPARRAIAYLINQRDIAKSIYKGLPEPGYHITPPPVYPSTQNQEPATVYDKHAKSGFQSETDFGANGYPYGMAESRISKARDLMQKAGYGSDSPYEVTFTVFSGDPAWDRIAKRVQDKGKAAYIDVTIEKADFGTIITKAINGKMDLFSLGDGMEWPESDNFLRFLNAHNPQFQFTRWGAESKSGRNKFMQQAYQAWEKFYKPNKGAGEENQRMRNKAYVIIEEMNWASVQELPTIHGVSQRFMDPSVREPMFGTMENNTFNTMMLNTDE